MQIAYVEISDLELKIKHLFDTLFDCRSLRIHISLDLWKGLEFKTLGTEKFFIKIFLKNRVRIRCSSSSTFNSQRQISDFWLFSVNPCRSDRAKFQIVFPYRN